VVLVAVKGESKAKDQRRRNLQLQREMMVLLAMLLRLPRQSFLVMEQALLVWMRLSHFLHQRRKGLDVVVGAAAARLQELFQLKFQASCSALTLLHL
jgi:hypothetical protein